MCRLTKSFPTQSFGLLWWRLRNKKEWTWLLDTNAHCNHDDCHMCGIMWILGVHMFLYLKYFAVKLNRGACAIRHCKMAALGTSRWPHPLWGHALGAFHPLHCRAKLRNADQRDFCSAPNIVGATNSRIMNEVGEARIMRRWNDKCTQSYGWGSQGNAANLRPAREVLPSKAPRRRPSKSFLIHHLLITISFDVI
jgi:hypothetical protein